MSAESDYKNLLIDNLNNNTYAKLAVFPDNKLGFVAIKDIPANTNPFSLTNNQDIFYDFVELNQSDIDHLDIVIKDFIRTFFCVETQTYFIPFFGLNTMNFIIYIRIDDANANITNDFTNLNAELINFKTIRPIAK